MKNIHTDNNANGVFDWLENLIFFLVGIVPIFVFLLGVGVATVGILKTNDKIQSGGFTLAALGGTGTGLSLLKKPGSADVNSSSENTNINL